MKLYTVREIAEILRCGLSNAYRLIETGKLPAFRVGATGKGYRVSDEHLQAFLAERREHPGSNLPPWPKRTAPQLLKHLDGERLRAAWREQGVE
jgi:excisionase family DNA binding protein